MTESSPPQVLDEQAEEIRSVARLNKFAALCFLFGSLALLSCGARWIVEKTYPDHWSAIPQWRTTRTIVNTIWTVLFIASLVAATQVRPKPKGRIAYFAGLGIFAALLSTCGMSFVRERPGHGHVGWYVPRVKANHRSFAVAIEDYYVEHQSYPEWSSDLQRNSNGESFEYGGPLTGLPTFLAVDPQRGEPGTLERDLRAAQSIPLSDLIRMLSDPYSPARGARYCYWKPNEPGKEAEGWIIWSAGPDHDYDLTLENIQQAYKPDERVPSDLLYNLTYDATNGSASSGDIYRTKQ